VCLCVCAFTGRQIALLMSYRKMFCSVACAAVSWSVLYCTAIRCSVTYVEPVVPPLQSSAEDRVTSVSTRDFCVCACVCYAFHGAECLVPLQQLTSAQRSSARIRRVQYTTMHTHEHTHAHMHSHAHAHTRTCTHTHVHTHMRMRSLPHACTYTHKHIHTHTHTHTRTQIHIHTDTDTLTHIDTDTHIHTQTRTHTHTRTLSLSHTHTHPPTHSLAL